MNKNSLFWEFFTSDSPAPSILCGTIHLGTTACMTHWDKIVRYIDHYDRIYTESSLAVKDMGYMQPFTLLAEGENLHNYVTIGRWDKMRQVYQKYCGVDIDQYKMLVPLFIIGQVQSRLLDADAFLPLDHQIWERATNLEKWTGGVETPQEQVAILQSLDLSHQYLQLIKISKNITKTRRSLKRIINTYATQDITKLYKMTKGSLGRDRSNLIKNRNHIMTARLIDYHNRQPSFFSFGAGHLAGGNGVLRLLKHTGATIRPV